MSEEELKGYECITTNVTDACPCITSNGPGPSCPVCSSPAFLFRPSKITTIGHARATEKGIRTEPPLLFFENEWDRAGASQENGGATLVVHAADRSKLRCIETRF